jgi:hypothetical protein
MNVVLVANHDWSNLGYILSECLNSVGIKSVMLIGNMHHFKYPNHGVLIKKPQQAHKYIEQADIIQFMHSQRPPWVKIKNKKNVVFHGGSTYRLKSEQVNKQFNGWIDMSLIQTPDLLGLGAKNEKWILPPINTESIQPVYHNQNDKLIFAHYPSSSLTKKSKNIELVINKIKKKYNNFEYLYSDHKVPWGKQIKRVSKCDIYIEKLNMKQGKMTTGVWSMAALEGAALGKIVITTFSHLSKYEKSYGKFELEIANSSEELEYVIEKFLCKTPEEIMEYKLKTRRWVEKYHSYKAIGTKLKNIYKEIL